MLWGAIIGLVTTGINAGLSIYQQEEAAKANQQFVLAQGITTTAKMKQIQMIVAFVVIVGFLAAAMYIVAKKK